MGLSIILSSMVVAMVNSQTVEKAASPYTNIGCQCSSLTFVDSSGHIQGNCKVVDNPWSYEACATPAVYQPTHAAHHQPAYAAHHQPAYVAHHEPVYASHHQPAYTAPQQPVYPAHHGHQNIVGHHQGPGHNINTYQPSGAFIPKSAVKQPTK